MEKHYKAIMDSFDNLMIALAKQKALGLDPDVVKSLKDVTKARNAFKRELNQKALRNEAVLYTGQAFQRKLN